MNKRNKKVNELNWSRKEKFQPCVTKAKLPDRFIKIEIVSAIIIYIYIYIEHSLFKKS